MTLEWALDILQIVFADIILSGDNALVIGMAAAGLAPDQAARYHDRHGNGGHHAHAVCGDCLAVDRYQGHSAAWRGVARLGLLAVLQGSCSSTAVKRLLLMPRQRPMDQRNLAQRCSPSFWPMYRCRWIM